MKRRKVLEKKKALDEIIRNASSTGKVHISWFPSYRHYNQNGLSVYLESGSGSQLSSAMKQYIRNLLKVNMEGPYGREWPSEEKVKRKEMVASEARYIFVREVPNAGIDESFPKAEEELNCKRWMGDGDPVVGFVQYRFVVEEEIPVVYVYELQLEHRVQGKGLGKFLMQLIELIACENHMSAVMLTVQKTNIFAMYFYISKLRYMVSSTSPSQMGVDKSYEILCKAFDRQAKEKLRGSVSLTVILDACSVTI